MLDAKKNEPGANQRGFWPLNNAYNGKNLVSGNGDLVLNGVNVESTTSEWLHALARFTGQAGSFAEIIANEGIKVSGSFSWIGAMKRKAIGDGALFEWDDG